MGWPSCFEVISEKLAESREIAQSLSSGKIAPDRAVRVVESILKQCYAIGKFSEDFNSLSKLKDNELFATIFSLREKLEKIEGENRQFIAEIKALNHDHLERRSLLELKTDALAKALEENAELRRRRTSKVTVGGGLEKKKRKHKQRHKSKNTKKVASASKRKKPGRIRVWRA